MNKLIVVYGANDATFQCKSARQILKKKKASDSEGVDID